jgi:hypothetical protein
MNNIAPTSMQQAIQHQLLSGIQTDNPVVNMLIGSLIVTMVGAIFNFISSINLRSYIPWSQGRFMLLKLTIWFKTYILQHEPQLPEARTIQSIDQDQKTNYLYDVMQWWLPQHLLVQEGDCREITLPDPISAAGNRWSKPKNDRNVPLKRPVMGTRTQVTFENCIISFSTRTEVRKMHIDCEIQRDVYIMDLTCTIPKSKVGILDRMIEVAVREYSNYLKTRNFKQRAFMNDGGQWKEVAKEQAPRPIETVILPGSQTQELEADLIHFLRGAEWYEERGLAYTRRYMFYGPPGCGKSSTIRAIAYLAQRDIYSMNLSQVRSDKELNDLFNKVPSETSVLVFEDIDCMSKVVHDRLKKGKSDENDEFVSLDEEKKQNQEFKIVVCNDNTNNRKDPKKVSDGSSGITLSALLNAIDGVVEKHGLIIVMTTNRKEVLDKALIRPGRVDFNLYFEKCTKDQFQGFYKLIFSKSDREVSELKKQLQLAETFEEQSALRTVIGEATKPVSVPLHYMDKFVEGKVSPAYVVITMLRYISNPDRALEEIVNKTQIEDPDLLE